MKYYYNKAQSNIEYGMLSSRKPIIRNVNQMRTFLLHIITIPSKNRSSVGITEKVIIILFP